ncbi:MAG TPA: hypothetical protein VJC03_07965, partial [bacterium]|nr:hypothetical protein [bacterium]
MPEKKDVEKNGFPAPPPGLDLPMPPPRPGKEPVKEKITFPPLSTAPRIKTPEKERKAPAPPHEPPSADDTERDIFGMFESARTHLEEEIAERDRRLEKERAQWLEALKTKDTDIVSIRRKMEEIETSYRDQREKGEEVMKGAVEEMQRQMFQLERSLEEERRTAWEQTLKAKEEERSSVKVEMALREVVEKQDLERRMDEMLKTRDEKEKKLEDIIVKFQTEKTNIEAEIRDREEEILILRRQLEDRERKEINIDLRVEREVERARETLQRQMRDLEADAENLRRSLREKEERFAWKEDSLRKEANESKFKWEEALNALGLQKQQLSKVEESLKDKTGELFRAEDQFRKDLEWVKERSREEKSGLHAQILRYEEAVEKLKRDLDTAGKGKSLSDEKYLKEIEILKSQWETERKRFAERTGELEVMEKEREESLAAL